MEFDALVWFRYILAILSVLVAVWLTLMSIRYWRNFEPGQKLWATGAVLILVYVADANKDAAAIELPFRWRLIPLVLGLIAYFAYLLEPRNRKILRFGKPMFGED